MNKKDGPEIQEESKAIPFSEFLESAPPGTVSYIADLSRVRRMMGGTIAESTLLTPELQLHCPNDSCNGIRIFRVKRPSVESIPDVNFHYFFLTYLCSNCRSSEKTYSLAAQRDANSGSGKCYKFGENPEYGPTTASRLIKLIGPDRELFLKGRRCENQGLGIGAFVYYRRVVEEQKNRILEEVIKVSRKVGAKAVAIEALENAMGEKQFSKAMASIKDAIPQALLINGHNPFTLLHSALSDGLHDRTDEHCLELASSIRVVLAELSERLSQALKDEVELNQALARLMAKK